MDHANNLLPPRLPLLRMVKDVDLTLSCTPLMEKSQSACERFLDGVWRSAAYSAVQMPYDGITQLVNKTVQTEICPKLQIVNPPEQASFGSLDWHGQQIGGAIGVAVPLLALQCGVHYGFKRTGLTDRILGKEYLAGKACTSGLAGDAMMQSLHPGRQMALLAAEAGTSGFLFDFFARPVKEDEPFLLRRVTNGVTGAVTWTTLSATVSGLKTLSINRNAVERPWVINTFRADLQRHAIAGGVAGVVDSQLHSLLEGKGFAGAEDTIKSAYSFAMVGSTLHSMSEAGNRVQGKQRIADIVNKSSELKALAVSDPVARELLSQAGELPVKKIENADVYNLLEFDFASKEYKDTNIGKKLERKPWKSLNDVIRSDVDVAYVVFEAINKMVNERYGGAPVKAKLIAQGKDSCSILLESNEVLKISWGKHDSQHGQRSFDAPAAEYHQATINGHNLTMLKQPLLNAEIPRPLNLLFRTNAQRSGYNFVDWLPQQLGYGRKLMLVDYFAVKEGKNVEPISLAQIEKLAGIAKLEANGNYLTPSNMRR